VYVCLYVCMYVCLYVCLFVYLYNMVYVPTLMLEKVEGVGKEQLPGQLG